VIIARVTLPRAPLSTRFAWLRSALAWDEQDKGSRQRESETGEIFSALFWLSKSARSKVEQLFVFKSAHSKINDCLFFNSVHSKINNCLFFKSGNPKLNINEFSSCKMFRVCSVLANHWCGCSYGLFS